MGRPATLAGYLTTLAESKCCVDSSRAVRWLPVSRIVCKGENIRRTAELIVESFQAFDVLDYVITPKVSCSLSLKLERLFTNAVLGFSSEVFQLNPVRSLGISHYDIGRAALFETEWDFKPQLGIRIM